VHFARIGQSERLQQVRDLLRARGETGATTADILDACPQCKAVSAAISELRANGIVISCEQTHHEGTVIARYRIESHLIASDPPAPLADSDSPTDLGYREIPEPPPDVPAHMIGDVIRFERMAKAERALFQRVCEGRAANGSCFLCAWIIAGDHEDVFPSYARKAHVLVCANPALDSNAEYLRRSQTAPAGDVAIPHRDGIGRPSHRTPSPATAAGAA
jgi:hypothetical protein